MSKFNKSPSFFGGNNLLQESLLPSCPRVHYDRSIFQSTIATEVSKIIFCCKSEIMFISFQSYEFLFTVAFDL